MRGKFTGKKASPSDLKRKFIGSVIVSTETVNFFIILFRGKPVVEYSIFKYYFLAVYYAF